jgi:CopG family nickel-responsive transcriptional regulator
MSLIKRFGVSIDNNLLKKFDKSINKKGYKNRSEAIRDLIRKNLINEMNLNLKVKSIATLTILYDHHFGNVTDKLLELQHNHTNEILVTSHVHVDHDNCLEVIVLKGLTLNIKELANKIKALKGIKHGELVITNSDI